MAKAGVDGWDIGGFPASGEDPRGYDRIRCPLELERSDEKKSKSDFAEEDVAEEEDLSVETFWKPKVQQLRGGG